MCHYCIGSQHVINLRLPHVVGPPTYYVCEAVQHAIGYFLISRANQVVVPNIFHGKETLLILTNVHK